MAVQTAKITSIEQIVGSLLDRVTSLETRAAAGSCIPAQQAEGTYLDMVMAPQPLGPSGPMAICRQTTTRIQHVDFILSQAPKMKMREVPPFHGSQVNKTTLGSRGSITCGKSPTYQPTTNPPGFFAESGLSARLVFETRAKCQDLVARYKDDGIPTKLIVHFVKAEPVSLSANPNLLKTEKSEDNLRALWENFVHKGTSSFPEGDDTGAFRPCTQRTVKSSQY